MKMSNIRTDVIKNVWLLWVFNGDFEFLHGVYLTKKAAEKRAKEYFSTSIHERKIIK